MGKWDWAFGAFLLFFANLLAIELAAAFVFGVFGAAEIEAQNARSLARFLRRYGVSVILLIAAGTFMTQTLMRTIADRRFSAVLQQAISDQARSTVGASLSQLRYQRHGDEIDVVAVVLTPQQFTPEQVGRLEDGLRTHVDRRIHLVLRSLISKDADRNGIVFIPEEQRERAAEVAAQTQFLRHASLILEKSLAEIAGARLVDLRRELNGEQNTVTAVARTPRAFEPAQVARMQEAFRRHVDPATLLIVRSDVRADTPATGFLSGFDEAKLQPGPR